MRLIGRKLTILARHMRMIFDQRVEQSGLTRAKWTLVATVARDPGLTQRKIADILEVSEVSAGRLIDRLCADGYLERRAKDGDRRAYCVFVTDAAQPMLQQLADIAVLHEEEMFAGVSEEQMAQLDAILDIIARNIAENRAKSGVKHPTTDQQL